MARLSSGGDGAISSNVGATETCAGFWIRARVDAAGTYTLTNSRNGFSKTYQVK